MYTPHLNPFICWWTLRFFHILATLNHAVMNSRVQVSFQSSVFVGLFFGYIPRSRILGSCSIFIFSSIFSFLRNSILFSTVTALIYISANRWSNTEENFLSFFNPLMLLYYCSCWCCCYYHYYYYYFLQHPEPFVLKNPSDWKMIPHALSMCIISVCTIGI